MNIKSNYCIIDQISECPSEVQYPKYILKSEDVLKSLDVFRPEN